ncbi:hypothetical protein Vqi01_40250 [Micromonospora qiuiae]|uniref:Uncharacterized protein n=1 Tax=Micromonospora qiuiae TaxID=502268 RepID=A0ABQ4JF77_9ACTN|nr:hypothetical protein Vqi01_40250 [Micromonospora qiuiae]
MSVPDEPEEIIIHIPGGRAVVIGPDAETEEPRWGRRVANLAAGEWASVLRTLDPVTRAFVESQRWAGSLVELDEVSRSMLPTARKIVEEDGWIQATLRNDEGKFSRVMRIRPGTGVASLVGGAAILSAVAAQAQTAQMARDIRVIRRRMDSLYQHLQNDQIGAAANIAEQVDGLVLRLREHGTDGVDPSEFPVIRNSLGDTRNKCLRHLQDAVTTLEDADYGSPGEAQKNMHIDTAQKVILYLDLLGKIHLDSVQFELAQVAFYYHSGKADVARTWSASTTKAQDQLRTQIEDVCGRLGRLDASIRALFRPALKHALGRTQKAGAAVTASAYTTARQVARSKTFRIPGVSFPIPVAEAAAVGGAVFTVGTAAVNAVSQARAQKKLDQRLRQLEEAGIRSLQTVDQARPNLELLETLAEELATSGGPR